MRPTVWINHALRPRARELMLEGIRGLGCEAIEAKSASPSVLTPGAPDPTLASADIAYGQPALADILASPRLRWVALSSAGYTRYDNEAFRTAMRDRGTSVTNASGVFAGPCAEHALAMMLALTRELPRYILNGVGPREWNYAAGRYSIETLTGATVLILGHGAIGTRLAEFLLPFRCRVLAYRRSPVQVENATYVDAACLPSALAAADHVVNCLPDSPLARRFCDEHFFARVKAGACFVNIGRGTTVDQHALAAALHAGKLGGAFLDALDPEPLPPSDPLWSAPNCHITPHLAGGHREQDDSLARHFLANLECFLGGRALADRVI